MTRDIDFWMIFDGFGKDFGVQNRQNFDWKMKLNINAKEDASRSAKKAFIPPVWPPKSGVGGMVTGPLGSG